MAVMRWLLCMLCMLRVLCLLSRHWPVTRTVAKTEHSVTSCGSLHSNLRSRPLSGGFLVGPPGGSPGGGGSGGGWAIISVVIIDFLRRHAEARLASAQGVECGVARGTACALYASAVRLLTQRAPQLKPGWCHL